MGLVRWPETRFFFFGGWVGSEAHRIIFIEWIIVISLLSLLLFHVHSIIIEYTDKSHAKSYTQQQQAHYFYVLQSVLYYKMLHNFVFCNKYIHIFMSSLFVILQYHQKQTVFYFVHPINADLYSVNHPVFVWLEEFCSKYLRTLFCLTSCRANHLSQSNFSKKFSIHFILSVHKTHDKLWWLKGHRINVIP